MLKVESLSVSYGAIRALHGVSFHVDAGEIVTLVGSNGAGKSTTLRALSGLLTNKSGLVEFAGENIASAAPHRIVALGLCQVPEGRMIFGNLTVEENLGMGAFLRRDRAEVSANRDYVFNIFPRLKERSTQVAGTLSGGEQQMLAIGRALMSQPKFLMLDEPSLGIAPRLITTIFEKILEINRDRKIPVLLVEQNARLALEISHRAYVLEAGHISMEGPSQTLRNNPQLKAAYLGG